MTSLEEWLATGGAKVTPKVKVAELGESGKGVVATSSITKGEVIAKIKRGQLLNFETIGHRGDAQDKKVRTSGLPGHLLLTYYLYRYHGDESNFWAPFIRSLPTMQDLSTMPLLWSATERGALPSHVLRKTRHQHDQVETERDRISKLLDQKIDPGLFKWAWLCVNTRCIYMNIPGTTARPDKVTLAPFADFLNHTPDGDRAVSIKVDGTGLTVTAKADYAVGEEIYLCYGFHNNAKLLAEYGFVVDNNPHESVDVTASIEEGLGPEKRKILDDLGYGGGEYTVEAGNGMSFRTVVAACVLAERAIGTIPPKLYSLVQGVEHPGVLYGQRLSDEWGRVSQHALDHFDKCKRRSANCKPATRQVIETLVQGYKRVLDEAGEQITNF